MTPRFANFTEAVRKRPGMYLGDFTPASPLPLVRALVQTLADPRVLAVQRLALTVRSPADLELEAWGDWHPRVLPALAQAAGLDLTEVLFSHWQAAMRAAADKSTDPDVLRFITFAQVGTVLYLVEQASVQITGAGGATVAQRFERGYLRGISPVPVPGGPALAARLTLGPESDVFDHAAWNFADMVGLMQTYLPQLSQPGYLETDPARQLIELFQTSRPR